MLRPRSLSRLGAQQGGAGLVDVEDRAAAVHRQHAFLHAGQHGVVLVLLPQDGADALVELFGHAVERLRPALLISSESEVGQAMLQIACGEALGARPDRRPGADDPPREANSLRAATRHAASSAAARISPVGGVAGFATSVLTGSGGPDRGRHRAARGGRARPRRSALPAASGCSACDRPRTGPAASAISGAVAVVVQVVRDRRELSAATLPEGSTTVTRTSSRFGQLAAASFARHRLAAGGPSRSPATSWRRPARRFQRYTPFRSGRAAALCARRRPRPPAPRPG